MATQTKRGEYSELPLSQLEESELNPRQDFEKTALKELALSIKENGLLQPISVRKHGKKYEIIAGARRFRASKEAGLTKVPCMVWEMTDEEATRACLMENLKRTDLNPMEEAAAYHDLTSGKDAIDVEEVATIIGKSAAYVRQRIVLNDLIKPFAKLVSSRELPLRSAILIARMQDADQEELRKQLRNEIPDYSQLEDVIHRNFTLRLKDAPFDITDKVLIPTAGKDGSCTTCPSRSGNDQSLFEDLPDKDTCTNPSCFQAKVEANVERELAKCKKDGLEILPKKAWSEVFPYSSDYIGGKEFVDAEKSFFAASETFDIAKLLKGHLQPVIAVSKTGRIKKLFRGKDVMEKLKELGKLPKGTRSSSNASSQQVEWKREKFVSTRICGAVQRAAESYLDLQKFLPYALYIIAGRTDATEALKLLKRRGFTDFEKGTYGRDALRKYVQVLCDTAEEEGSWLKPNALFVELLLCHPMLSITMADGSEDLEDELDGEPNPFAYLEIDIPAVRAEAEKEFAETNGKGYKVEPVEEEEA